MGTLYRNGVPYIGSGGAGGIELTEAEYEALPTSEKMNGTIYFITDGSVSYPTASEMRYDNTESQIPATSVQGAIDENRIEIDELKNGLTHVDTTSVSTSYGTVYFRKFSNGLKSVSFESNTLPAAQTDVCDIPSGYETVVHTYGSGVNYLNALRVSAVTSGQKFRVYSSDNVGIYTAFVYY